MRGMIWTLVAVAGWSTNLCGDEPQQPRNKTRVEETLEVRTYPVADLVVPLGPGKEAEFQELERHLRNLTGLKTWNEARTMKHYASTLSLVIRQTPDVHEKIAGELNRLRRELDVQTVLEFRVITGPRREIASLTEAFPGELGKFEVDQLLQSVAKSQTLKTVISPKMTTFSRQTAQIQFDGRAISANAQVSDDRRSVRLNIVEGPEQERDLLAGLQSVQLHSGRSAALRFEAPRKGSVIPPAADAIERLIVVTARVLIVEEEEEQHKVVLTVSPRLVIQEEEEELLGIPTE